MSLLAGALALSCSLAGAAPAAPYGVLLMAHGGDPRWNAQVDGLRDGLDARVPTEVAFGMADPAELQRAISSLEARGSVKIVAVPLFVNSSSEVLEQTRYVLGLKKEPSEVMRKMAALMASAHGAHGGHGGHPAGPHAMFSTRRVKLAVPLTLTPALDAHPLVARVLLDRARGLSREPAAETVVLIGHGPVDDAADVVWRATMARLARTIRKDGGFSSVRSATLRDDAPEPVRGLAVGRLRAIVEEAGRKGGRVLVIPYLIAQGGIEQKIVAALEGLKYDWDAKTIMPHVNIARWLSEAAAEGSRGKDMRRFD